MVQDYAKQKSDRTGVFAADQASVSKAERNLARVYSGDGPSSPGFNGRLVTALVDLKCDELLRDALAAEEVHSQRKHPKAEAKAEARVGKVLPGTFSAYFQRLHAVHQTVLVGGGPISGGGGPCTPGVQHGFASAGDLACLPLAPSHAFYDKLLREWMTRHGRTAADLCEDPACAAAATGAPVG